MSNNDSDSEEEILVYVEFKDNVNIDQYKNIHVLGINGKQPIVQMDDSFFIGKYANPLGTYMFFEEDPTPHCSDVLFDKMPESSVKFIYKTRKYLQMEHAYVTTKEGKGTMAKKKMKYSKLSLEEFFQELNRKHIKIQKCERKQNNEILNAVLEQLLMKMKACDDLFRSMNPKLEFLGSYYDGLRVGHATEYDINIVLKIHVNYEKITLDSNQTQDAYTIVKMPAEFRRLSKTHHTANKGFHCTKMWCDREFRLSVKKFKSWMQSVVDAAVNTLPIQNNLRILEMNGKIYQVSTKLSGPANTIILTDGNNVIDVDLVPTLSFNLPKVPLGTKIDFVKVESTNLNQYFVVPKLNENDFSWRLAFPFQERTFINRKYNMKSALKILKLLRDNQGFKKLASYFIKTLFLWESEEQSDEFWKQNSLSFLVIHMIKKLRDCLANGMIRNFWCSNHNLLEKVKLETCRHWSNRLTHIINVIEKQKDKNPHLLLKYFVNNND